MKFSRKVFVPKDPKMIGVLYRDATGYRDEPLRPESSIKTDAVYKWTQYSYALSVMGWKGSGRPYFNVWPTVEDALLRTNLQIDPGLIPQSIIHKLRTIEIRFCDSSKRDPFFLNATNMRWWKMGDHSESFKIADSTVHAKGIYVCRAWIEDDQSITTDGAGMPYGVTAVESDYWKLTEELRIAIGIMLLACDDRYCEPILLNRDKNRKLTGGDLERAIDRARRNGQYGFNIGEHVEVSPHYRRPHFAIRWTGEGRKVPRIVPVKGAMINKDVLKEIPTGYEG